MWYKSEVNKGSEFYFTLPYQPVEAQLKSEDIINISPDNANWGDLTFLVAEDDESNFQFIELIVKETKVKLIWAKNGKEAVEKFKENRNLDLILMDLRMPIMSGFEAVGEIRKMDKNVPIIVQTAYAQIDDIQKIRETECDDYITKPINKEILIKTIYKYVK